MEVSSLDFSNPSKNQYAFWMEGFDKDWVYTETRRSVNYNLIPGRYTLHVKGTNSDGVWSRNVLSLGIHIHPSFWMTHWFQGLCGLTFLASVFAIYRWRTHQSKKHRLALQELNEDLLEQIHERELVEKDLIKETVFNDKLISCLPGIFYLYNKMGRLVRWNDNFVTGIWLFTG